MSERIVDNPANHGWVEENGKWVWEGGATTGHIEDGTVQGQITTWDVAKTEWTPDSSLTASGHKSLCFYGMYETVTRDAPVLDLTSYEDLEKDSDSEPALPPLEDE